MYSDVPGFRYHEMLEAGRNINEVISIPLMGDGDTGFGNAMNVKRTVKGYAQAGFASIMLEDQLAPKRCGHTRGKQVVSRAEALTRMKAAVDAREEVKEELGLDIMIQARTDTRQTDSFDEALTRMRMFADLGADILFLEAPESEEEMYKFCQEFPEKIRFANMLEGGKTPVLPIPQLAEMGYSLAAYPLTLLSGRILLEERLLKQLKTGHPVQESDLASFRHVQEVVGFDEYWASEDKYK